ncbi:hypothetical protein BDZ97DRAFT_1782757 [Flammula alnicola]|nr:hypothetical protein BDZ97DRAFT_1782757 [Flammula alnicola]
MSQHIIPFPFDILLCVTDELAISNDKRTLTALAQTSRELLPICQKHIFREVSFLNRDPSVPGGTKMRLMRLFLALLEHSPNLANYIHELHYDVEFIDKEQHVVIQKLFSTLRHLREVHLEAGPLGKNSLRGLRGYLNWQFLDPLLSYSITHLFSVPNLRRLHLGWFSKLPASIFLSINSIHMIELSIVAVHIEDDVLSGSYSSTTLASRSRIPCLGSYSGTGECGDGTMILLDGPKNTGRPLFDFTNLKCLSVHSMAHPLAGVNALENIVKMAGSLQILRSRILGRSTCKGLSNLFTLGLKHTLTTLEINIVSNRCSPTFKYGFRGPFRTLCHELRALSPDNVLQNFTVSCQCYPSDDGLKGELVEFDAALHRTAFLLLRRVTFRFSVMTEWGSRPPTFVFDWDELKQQCITDLHHVSAIENLELTVDVLEESTNHQ